MRHVISFVLFFQLLTVSSWAGEYYVAGNGRDEDPGTKERPFRTIQKAAEVMGAGDTCLIRAGVYRETVRPKNSGEAGRPIRFAAFPNETVTVSGADLLTAEWSLHNGNTYRAATDRQFVQLFVDGRMMFEARWPNSPLDDLMAMQRAKAGEGTDYDALAAPDLPPGDWNGALVLMWPGSRWSNSTRRVLDYAPGKGFRFDTTFRRKTQDKYHQSDPYRPQAGNPYILFGCLAALDSPGEWCLDADRHTLYLWPPGGGSPAGHAVEVKQRDYAFDLSDRAGIELRGFSVFAAAINMSKSRDCLVEDCRLRYVDHFREMNGYKMPEAKNAVTGRNNEWRRCLIAFSASTALRVGGEDNRLVNCIVHDANYLGTYQGGVDLGRSVGTVVSHCTVFRTGRDIIQHHGARRIRIEYNDLWNANMLNNDSGATYAWGTDGEGSVIAHNWVHDNMGDATVGIYLDNFDRNFVVHHNVVWNNADLGIQLNSDSLNNLVCNNTLFGNERAFGTFTYHGYTPTQKGTRIINNLVIGRMPLDDPHTFVQGDLAPEVHHNGYFAIGRNGAPTPDSGAIDAGIVIPGITDGYRGKAPDLGAYEYGGDYWVAGADWKDETAPSPPPMDLAFAPRKPVTEAGMITDGLQVWLDAADGRTLETDGQGKLRRWQDRSGQGHHAAPADPSKPLLLQMNALNGKPVVRGTGAGSLRVGTVRAGSGAFTLFVVSQSSDASGPPWQRIIGAWCGKSKDWLAPNWIIMRPGNDKPAAYAAKVFTLNKRDGCALDGITLFGSPCGEIQFLTGDIAEVLLFDRSLRFDEADAVEKYLAEKWALK